MALMIIAGVEEAGRGPLIGPMVMCICCIEEKEEFQLKALGVKDSKLLTPDQREHLFLLIKSMTTSKLVIIPPKEVDAAVETKGMNLNWLEAKTTAKLISSMRPDKVILDCPSNNIKAYSDYVRRELPEKFRDMNLIAEHKADVNYPIVSAASILAKVTRDREIEKIKKQYHVDFGSGYPSDPRTIAFVKENWQLYPFFRKSWGTYKAVASQKVQKKLGDF
jgi:ribonuclease HII